MYANWVTCLFPQVEIEVFLVVVVAGFLVGTRQTMLNYVDELGSQVYRN